MIGASDGGTDRSTAGPGGDAGGALRAGASSTPPTSPPPADGAAGAARPRSAESADGGSSAESAGSAAGGGGGEGPSGSAGDGQVERDLEALLADAHRERDEYLELAKRTKADFENFRKRMAADLQAASARGKGELIREVVPVLDDLERALEAAGLDPEGDSEDGLAHGVLLVFRGLRETLARNGVEAVDPKGEKFDPMAHEALSTRPAAEGVEPGVVVETMQKGYRLGEQLIRPARVVVSE